MFQPDVKLILRCHWDKMHFTSILQGRRKAGRRSVPLTSHRPTLTSQQRPSYRSTMRKQLTSSHAMWCHNGFIRVTSQTTIKKEWYPFRTEYIDVMETFINMWSVSMDVLVFSYLLMKLITECYYAVVYRIIICNTGRLLDSSVSKSLSWTFGKRCRSDMVAVSLVSTKAVTVVIASDRDERWRPYLTTSLKVCRA